MADSGAGSFRTGVSSGNRTIVFDVGGTIVLSTAVSCSSSLTIAGQTAPGGIKFDGGEISFANRNIIICRYLRIRPGSATASTSDDALSFYRASNIIMDHSSIAYAPWNNLDGVGDSTHLVTAITLQHCINANPTGQQFGAHTESVGGQWSWQYKIFANSHNRNPLAKVNDTFINNLEYNNSAGYTTHTSTRFKHDIVNNYFVAGPASGGNFPWYQIDNNQSIYFTGNLYDSDKNGGLGGSTTVPLPGYQGGGTILSSPWSSWTTIIPTMTPALAYRYDLSTAGAFPRGEVDALIVGQMKTIGTGGPGGGLYTTQAGSGPSNNGYGTIIGLTAPTDTDGDGMPDYWELANGSNPNVANPLTNTVTGYTLLENYLNYLAAPHGATQTNTPVDLNLAQFTTGFFPGAAFSLTNAPNGTNAHFVPTANFSGLGSFNFIVTEATNSLNVAVTVCVTPVAPPASAVAFNGALIGPTITTVSLPPPANLIWRGDGAANTWNTSVSNWFNGSGLAAFKAGDVVSFDDSGSNTPAINLSATVSPGAFVFDSTNSYQVAGSGSLSGSMNLSKSSSGSLTFFNPNSFTGGATLNEGTLILSNLNSLGSGTFTLNGGTALLISTGGPAIFPNAVTVAAPSTIQVLGNSGYNNEAFNAAFTGSANLDFNIAGNATFSARSGMTLSGYSGTMTLRAPGTLRWQGGVGSSTVAFDLWTNGIMIVRDGGTITLGSLAGAQSSSGTGDTLYVIGGNNADSVFSGNISATPPSQAMSS